MAGLFDKFRVNRPKVDSSRSDEAQRAALPSDLWIKCSDCGNAMYRKVFQDNLKVCDKCGFHHKLTAHERLELLADAGTFEEWDRGLYSGNPLSFATEYLDKLDGDRKKTGLEDAVLSGKIDIHGLPLGIAIMDFGFRGGSMGSVVGEKITRVLERSGDLRIPAMVVTCSGGARMQEGMLSLMQMVRTSAAVRRLNELAVPYFCLLTDPTTAGVAASFAALGDVIVAEPRAIIGFAGARVIEQTIRQKLPPGFQTSEFFQKHGFIDMVVPRAELKATLGRMVSMFTQPVLDRIPV